MRYAAIDAGTNSCRLLLAEVSAGGLTVLQRDLQTTRLGEGMLASGIISPTAIERTVLCLKGFETRILESSVEDYRIVATSAVREARNQTEFLRCTGMALEKPLEVITGTEEAALSYLGVKKGLCLDAAPLVVDLGGGSTEVIHYGQEFFSTSLLLGAVTATEGDFSAAQIKTILAPIARRKYCFMDSPLVFVGGTATSLASIHYQMDWYDPERVHGTTLEQHEVAQIYNRLQALSLPERCRVKGLQPERADIIIKGIYIILCVMKCLDQRRIIISESDLLEGIIWTLAT